MHMHAIDRGAGLRDSLQKVHGTAGFRNVVSNVAASLRCNDLTVQVQGAGEQCLCVEM